MSRLITAGYQHRHYDRISKSQQTGILALCILQEGAHSLTSRIYPIGNDATIEMPSRMLEAAKLQIGQDVHVWVDNGRVMIEAVNPPHNNLNDLLAGITEDNLSGLLLDGPPRGNEF